MVKNFKVGDVLSESSHYVVTGIYGNDTVLKHQESGDSVHINKMYIEKYLESADEVINEVKVTILPYEEGEDRVLRGFKIQFESRDGRYNCVDNEELITLEEYKNRCNRSTCLHHCNFQ